VVNQINGSYSVKAVNLIPLHKKAVNLAKEFDNVNFRWIPRKQNKEADELSRKAYRKFLSKKPKSREEKAKELIDNVTHLHRSLYIVRSQTNVSTLYLVDISKNQCNCPDFENRGLICKHILAAKMFDKRKRGRSYAV